MGISVGASVVYLPDTGAPYPTLVDFLANRFPQISEETWIKRIIEKKVTSEDSEPVTLDTPYMPNQRLFYFREVVEEPEIPFKEQVVFSNEHFMVVCKPHFLPITPTGPYVQECLLNRLKKQTGNPELTPINRIDRETAGLVLISSKKSSRGLYQQLFMHHQVRKIYEAVTRAPEVFEKIDQVIENRLARGEPWFRMRISKGLANSRTQLRLAECDGKFARFHLQPVTGKKHQLRIHLSSIGLPIINDRLYPELGSILDDNFNKPLQLLSRQVEFQDPVTKKKMVFTSPRQLRKSVVDTTNTRHCSLHRNFE